MIEALVLATLIVMLHFAARVVHVEAEKERGAEQERQNRLRALYPKPPSYEERMGVRYGSGQTGPQNSS